MTVSVLARISFVLAACGAFVAGPALAQETARPALLESLLSCRSVSTEADRLACFDRAAAAFDTAERAGDVQVIDQRAAHETRARLFGLNLGTANIFGRLREDAPIDAIETTLTSARQDGRGAWAFRLADGSVWRQIDGERLATRATPGSSVRIRRGALGSFLLSVNGARSLRVNRDE